MKYVEVDDGVALHPRHDRFFLRCCDCGLTHRVTFRIVRLRGRRQIRMRTWRDERKTAAYRRAHRIRIDHAAR